MAVKVVDELLREYRSRKSGRDPVKLHFHQVDGYDVYNPTAVFDYDGRKVLCARVEKRESENSRAVFFYEREENHFYPLEGAEAFALQDPFLARIGGSYVFGGTEIFPHPDNPADLCWHTKFLYGNSLDELTELTCGPKGMKDVRIVELADGRIGVFSRPQGEKGGRGKIGFAIVPTLEQMTPQVIEEAPLLELFAEEEWGGANEAVLLADGRIGVLGHIAKFTEGEERHYYPAAFVLEPRSGEHGDLKIIAERADFVEGPSKRPDLKDVLFSGGCVLESDGSAVLYVGVSDCEVQKIRIENPFLH